MPEQTYRNHRKFVPLYHFVVFPVLLVNLLWALYRIFQSYPGGPPLFDRVLGALVAAALVATFFFARIFALSVQDRVIRGEMQARLAALLPPDLRPRIGELTARQLVALRFAGDEELPELTRRVLDGTLRGGNQIKQQIQRWRADDLRA